MTNGNLEPTLKPKWGNMLLPEERELLVSFKGDLQSLLKSGFYFVEMEPPDSFPAHRTRVLDFIKILSSANSEPPWKNACVLVEEFTPFLNALEDAEAFGEQFISFISNVIEKLAKENNVYILPVIPRPHLRFFRLISDKWKQIGFNGSEIRLNFVFPSLERNGVFIGDISNELKEKIQESSRIEKKQRDSKHDRGKKRFKIRRTRKDKPRTETSRNQANRSKKSNQNSTQRYTGDKKKRRRRRRRSQNQNKNNYNHHSNSGQKTRKPPKPKKVE
ncbi:MAG: hypothetical protein ACFFBD_01310 [Candidatus Hodarchaeota archaeon]